MKTSVIISTYNSSSWLQKVMWGYSEQSQKDFEIIIADDGTSGRELELTRKIVKEAKHNTRHVWQEDDGFRKCRILNKAIEQANGEYLIFTDGDCIPHPDFVQSHTSKAKPRHFLSGGYTKLPMDISKYISRKHISSGDCFRPLWLLRNGLRISGDVLKISAKGWRIDGLMNKITPAKRTFNGNNSSCFKADAIAINGFDERMHYGGEDREFGYRLTNSGVKPLGMRYSAPCLHLDHARGYVDEALRQQNKMIIEETRMMKKVKTEFGLMV